jgi:hypothetical protein
MQKITALFTVGIIGAFAAGRVRHKGLVYCETLGRDEALFRDILGGLRKSGIFIKNQISNIKDQK